MIKISIITAVRNSAATIAECLKSVRNQTYPAEQIVVDGASTDGTLSIVRQTRPDARIVSEPDQGVYDAMNKGIALAGGEVVGILNSDDFYAAPDVLERVAALFADPEVDACYGDLVYVDARDTGRVMRYWRSGGYDARRFYHGWMPPHPTFFVRRRLYERYGSFDTTLGSAADYELMLRFLVRHGVKTAYLPRVLVKMRTGGMSNATLANRLRANRMDRKAWEVNGLRPYPWTLILKPLRKVRQWLDRP